MGLSAASLGESNDGGGALGLAYMSGGGPLCCTSEATLGESNDGGGALGLAYMSGGDTVGAPELLENLDQRRASTKVGLAGPG